MELNCEHGCDSDLAHAKMTIEDALSLIEEHSCDEEASMELEHLTADIEIYRRDLRAQFKRHELTMLSLLNDIALRIGTDGKGGPWGLHGADEQWCRNYKLRLESVLSEYPVDFLFDGVSGDEG